MKPTSTAFYPPLYFERLRCLKRLYVNLNIVFGALACIFTWGYLQAQHDPIFELAPVVAAPFVLSLLWTYHGWRDAEIVRILPYFKKSEIQVEANTFSTGQVLAQFFEVLESLATREQCEPLSTFGFADDLQGETVTWYDTTQGLKTVSTLLSKCRKEIKLHGNLENDLERLELALSDADSKKVPFCLLLRHGSGWSGAEMDLRQGNFGYWRIVASGD